VLRIRELREARGWSQEKLAYTAGVSLGTIQNAEGGRGVRSQTLQKIADALGLQIGDLFVTNGKRKRRAS